MNTVNIPIMKEVRSIEMCLSEYHYKVPGQISWYIASVYINIYIAIEISFSESYKKQFSFLHEINGPRENFCYAYEYKNYFYAKFLIHKSDLISL